MHGVPQIGREAGWHPSLVAPFCLLQELQKNSVPASALDTVILTLIVRFAFLRESVPHLFQPVRRFDCYVQTF
jgi:hypothetical protein